MPEAVFLFLHINMMSEESKKIFFEQNNTQHHAHINHQSGTGENVKKILKALLIYTAALVAPSPVFEVFQTPYIPLVVWKTQKSVLGLASFVF